MRTAAVSLVILLALAAPALGADNGEGLLGETDDRVVTLFSLGVLLFFVLVVVLGSLVQARLDKRKDEKKAHQVRQRTGW